MWDAGEIDELFANESSKTHAADQADNGARPSCWRSRSELIPMPERGPGVINVAHPATTQC
jgi:hypothetical protein